MTWRSGARVFAIVVGAAIALPWLQASVARADGGGSCSLDGVCEVSDIAPPSGGSGGAGGSGDVEELDTRRDLPECGALTGAQSTPPDDPTGWVEVACMEGSIAITLWSEAAPNAEQIARSLVARVRLEPIEIGLTPLPEDQMGLVGLPVWLWVEDPSRTTWGPATISAGGVTLTAEVESTTWDMGDGTKLRCGVGTKWRSGVGDDPSPTCGHTYLEQGRYTVRARSHWVARWSGYGQSGTIPVTLSATRRLDIGEIQVIRIPD